MRPAPAILVASANRPLVCASASPTTGASSARSPATAAPTDSATPIPACATATPAGGHPRVIVHASATQRRAVTSPLEPAYAHQAGGAAVAASVATVTPRPACRSLAAASACQAGGVRSVVVSASVCEANAALLRATAPVLLASMESAVSSLATLATMGPSAKKAVATVSRMLRALPSRATVSPASRAGTGLSASSHVHRALLVRSALGSAPAAGLGSPVKRKLGTASAATLVGWGTGVRTLAPWVPLGRAAAQPARPVFRGLAMR